jgi:DNA invertase Pin-like site-specific DNA recombinase
VALGGHENGIIGHVARALIYTRVSRDEQDQTSTQDQERECRTLAKRLKITDIVIFAEEPGTSGY